MRVGAVQAAAVEIKDGLGFSRYLAYLKRLIVVANRSSEIDQHDVFRVARVAFVSALSANDHWIDPVLKELRFYKNQRQGPLDPYRQAEFELMNDIKLSLKTRSTPGGIGPEDINQLLLRFERKHSEADINDFTAAIRLCLIDVPTPVETVAAFKNRLRTVKDKAARLELQFPTLIPEVMGLYTIQFLGNETSARFQQRRLTNSTLPLLNELKSVVIKEAELFRRRFKLPAAKQRSLSFLVGSRLEQLSRKILKAQRHGFK